MILQIQQLIKIAANGGSIEINASLYTLNQLKQIAGKITNNSGTLTLKNVGHLTAKQLQQIASLANGQIEFDFAS